jgi:hypothetical protein
MQAKRERSPKDVQERSFTVGHVENVPHNENYSPSPTDFKALSAIGLRIGK